MRRNRPGERGESVLETLGIVALTITVIGAIAYIAIVRPGQPAAVKLTPEQQAYVAAVATQQAQAYIAAVATMQSQQPAPASPARQQPQAVAPTPIPPSQAPATAPTSPPAAPPQAPPAPPAPTATPVPPPAPVKPPMATCVGFMVGLTSTGIEACQSIVGGDGNWDTRIRTCVNDIITGNGTTGVGGADCTAAALIAGDPNLSDCFMGLAGKSHFGRTSCRQYYGSQ